MVLIKSSYDLIFLLIRDCDRDIYYVIFAIRLEEMIVDNSTNHLL